MPVEVRYLLAWISANRVLSVIKKHGITARISVWLYGQTHSQTHTQNSKHTMTHTHINIDTYTGECFPSAEEEGVTRRDFLSGRQLARFGGEPGSELFPMKLFAIRPLGGALCVVQEQR